MKRILLIDDDPTVRGAFRKILEREGYDVVTASNGKAAMRSVRQKDPDIVITDMLMPEQDGVETIMELRRDYPELKVVAISGGGCISSDYYLEVALKLGVETVLHKPLKREKLLATVEKILNKPSQHRKSPAVCGGRAFTIN